MNALTPFQTVGPFLRLGLRSGTEPLAAVDDAARITIRGRLLDGRGDGIPDGVLEFWHPGLALIQRALTGDDGTFALETVRPPVVPDAEGRPQSPHFVVGVLGRGILTHYITRMYFADDSRNADDVILSLVPESRRHTLMATPLADAAYDFDVVVQGDRETVFFDL